MYLAFPSQSASPRLRISRSINTFHTLVFDPCSNSLIHNDFRTLPKNRGVVPNNTPSPTGLDLAVGARYCANETPVASLPHPAATSASAQLRLDSVATDLDMPSSQVPR